MSAFVAHDLTISGLRMIADAAAGKLIEYTRIALGDGYMHPAQTPQNMTGLVNETLSLQPSKIKANGDGTVTVSTYFTNAALLVGFFYREIGLFAKHPDTGEEQLYCYGNAADFAEWIPPSGSSTTVEKIVDVVTVIGTAVAITANINMALGATLRDIDDHDNDITAHPDIRKKISSVQSSAEAAQRAFEDLDAADIKQNAIAGEDGKPLSVNGALGSLNENVTDVQSALANKVNIGAPAEYDLTLNSGYVEYHPCRYAKTQENIVVINASLRPATGFFPTSVPVIAVLPVGFRPSYAVELPATFTGTEPRLTGLVQILPDGNIRLVCDKDGQVYVHFGAAFVAF